MLDPKKKKKEEKKKRNEGEEGDIEEEVETQEEDNNEKDREIEGDEVKERETAFSGCLNITTLQRYSIFLPFFRFLFLGSFSSYSFFT